MANNANSHVSFRFFLQISLPCIFLISCGGSDKSFIKASPDDLTREQAYQGSVFKELKAQVWDNPYDNLPVYKVDKSRIHSGEFEKSSARTIDTHFDLLESNQPKIVHPNGVCLTGIWEIAADNPANPYTGYFANGHKGLILARASSEGDTVQVANKGSKLKSHLTGSQYISYGLVGKLFPTEKRNDPKRYKPAHFVVQTDLGGQTSGDLSDVEMLNAPDVSVVRRGLVDGGFVGGGVRILARTGNVFEAVDESTTIRQTYEIAELSKPPQSLTNAPKYLKLVTSSEHRRKLNKGDFRIAMKDYIEKEGEMSYDILVANEGRKKTKTKLKQTTIVTDVWTAIGRLTFSDAVTSKVCDSNLHFHHPAWRRDRNDPDSRVRPAIPENSIEPNKRNKYY